MSLTQHILYTLEDLELYLMLKAEQRALSLQNKIIDAATGQYTPEWNQNWQAFERLRNLYNGMPPKQLAKVNA